MPRLFENTLLWKKSLGNEVDILNKEHIEKLRGAFINTRNKVSGLVNQISATFPNLTQHDISHLDALWDTASIIAGEDLPLNPLEGFILGCAILIHDSALCFEAYPLGQQGIRNTLQWKDAYEDLKEKKGLVDGLEEEADFISIRHLHAIQAEELLDHCWNDPDNGQQIFLLEDQSLRKHYGKLIGKIAASHHWDIETIISTFSNQQNALPSLPREWRVDPIKIACLLRCADAAHIDNRRAPDFLYALIKRNGLSLTHWKGQNRLGVIDIDQTDTAGETLLFTSTIDFEEHDADSWFVIYDAASLVDKEIKSCNSILSQSSVTSFKIKKVAGIDSPVNFSKYVKAKGWQPCSAQVHVNNIEKLVKTLGGEMLYGSHSDLTEVAIRELIQNSRDAIKARQFIDPGYQGKIQIAINQAEGNTFLSIEDDGVGMSERVLTDSLLDFGTSFWTSDIVKSEFPGLRSSGFKAIGKFGIGFYSVFMIADSVIVSSRNWNTGLPDINTLKFSDGFTYRPLLVRGNVPNFRSTISTKVSLLLKPNIIPENLSLLIKTNRIGSTNFNVPIQNYLSAICAGLDVRVLYSYNDEKPILIHENIESESFDIEQWLTNISFAKYHTDGSHIQYIKDHIHRLRPIKENGRCLGIAAISTKYSGVQDFLSLSAIGGLANTVHYRDGDNFIGYIDFMPKSAKRDIGDFVANIQTIKEWAKNQEEILNGLTLQPYERYFAASSLCHFGVDPINIAKILVSHNNKQIYLTFKEMVAIAKCTGVAFLESGFGGHIEVHHNIEGVSDYALILPLSNSSFLDLKFNGSVPENNYTILDCLYRAIIDMKLTPIIKKHNNIHVNKFGQNINMLIVTAKD